MALHEERGRKLLSYSLLPTSVFQTDLNLTNLLVNDRGAFMCVYDFNLCGRDDFLNYFMRENYGSFEQELEMWIG